MDDVLDVEVLDTPTQLVDNGDGLRLGEALALLCELEEVTRGAELEEEVDVVLVAEAAVEGDHVGVLKTVQDFDLAA